MNKRDGMGLNQAKATEVRENSVGWFLKTLSVRLDRRMNQLLEPLGLTLGQFAILMTLLEGDGISQTEIGRKISMPGYATTRNLDTLEKNGLLERHQNEASRRSFCIRLTRQGKELAPTLFEIVHRVNGELLSTLGESKKKNLTQILIELVIAYDEKSFSSLGFTI